MKTRFLVLVVWLALPIFAWGDNERYSLGERIGRALAPGEIEHAKCVLERIRTVGDVSGRTEGTAVFEGTVMIVEASGRQSTVTLNVEWSAYGVSVGDNVKIVQEHNDYMLSFVTGSRYRVAAYRESEDWRTWAWMGSFDLNNPPQCEDGYKSEWKQLR